LPKHGDDVAHSFDPKYPGTGWFWRLFMTAVLKKIASDLAAAADKRAERK